MAFDNKIGTKKVPWGYSGTGTNKWKIIVRKVWMKGTIDIGLCYSKFDADFWNYVVDRMSLFSLEQQLAGDLKNFGQYNAEQMC